MKVIGRLVWPVLVLLMLLPSCGNVDHVNIFHVTFTVDGVTKDYTTNVGFSTLCLYPSGTYCISFLLDSKANEANGFSISVPTAVTKGSVYRETSSSFRCFYDNASHVRYQTDTSQSFSLTVVKWDGAGGYGSGTFSGTLHNESGLDTAIISNGTFEGFIHN